MFGMKTPGSCKQMITWEGLSLIQLIVLLPCSMTLTRAETMEQSFANFVQMIEHEVKFQMFQDGIQLDSLQKIQCLEKFWYLFVKLTWIIGTCLNLKELILKPE
jgi:hypothetical protein